MPATSVSSLATGNLALDAIDSGARWSGDIAYNRVDPLNPAEVSAFSTNLPSSYQTSDAGLTSAMWDLVSRSLTLLKSYASFAWSITDGTDANYFVSDFFRPDNADVAGIAAQPGNGPILAFNRNTWLNYSGQQQQWIVLHELGHTLGLRHQIGLPEALDYSQYSIMSYNWFQLGDQYTGEGLPLTPMALDVALLQAKYGAASANVGPTRYILSRFGADTDGTDNLVQNGGGYVCIWDSAGSDSLAYYGSAGALLNLNAATLQTTALAGDLADVIGDVAATSRIFAGFSPTARDEMLNPVRTAGGFFSSSLTATGREIGGFTIAKGVKIEVAIGGPGDDLLIGNELGNVLQGNAGHDDLYGGSGDDNLDGVAGDDRVFGGLGADTIADTGGGSNYLRGDEGDDWIEGGAGFDDINGNMGNDTGSGGLGDDWVVGGKDNDVLTGGDGSDLVYGNLGADTISGDAGHDIVRGGQQDDILSGGVGDDYVSGDRDNDTVTGGVGADIFHTFGAAGLDRVTDFNLSEGDRVQLDPGTIYTVTQSGADTVINMDGGGQMVLVGVTMSTLTPGWIFGA